jgi:oxygen-independent coproporphyrinogen-3 oxidase
LPKRCHFCYFRVYTDKNSQQVAQYLDLLAREWDLLREQPALAGREIDYVYFGGGTPSFLSTQQLSSLVSRLTAHTPWSSAEEITFECEPGTLTETKLDVIRRLGVTRLSLGVENFDDGILEVERRAHRSPEIATAYAYARNIGFPQINIDLIAGMLGETDEKLAGAASSARSSSIPTASPSTRWSCRTTRRSRRHPEEDRQFTQHVAPWETAAAGYVRRSTRSSARAIRSGPPTRP